MARLILYYHFSAMREQYMVLTTLYLYCLKNAYFLIDLVFGPRCDKTCLRGFGQSEIQTNLLSYRDKLEN